MISISLEGQEAKVPLDLVPRGRPNPIKIAQFKDKDGTKISIWAKRHKNERYTEQDNKG